MATDKLVEIDHVKDFISREAAIALTDQHCFETSYDAVWMEEELRKLPAADVRPVVRGEWEYNHKIGERGQDTYYWVCSKCKNVGHKSFHFCPACGADMREVSEDG